MFNSIFILCSLLNMLYTLFMDEFSFVYIVHVISNDLSVVRPLVKEFSSSILGQLFYAQHFSIHYISQV